MTVLIDSWAWIEYWKGTTHGAKAKSHIEGEEEILTSAVNVAEVYRYFIGRSAELAEKYYKTMNEMATIIPLDPALAREAAIIRYEKKMGLGDAIVLATAIAKKANVVTGDPDFKNEKNVIYIG